MLMSLPELVATYNMDITGVLHVGAHLGEEAPIYAGLGIENVWWIEGNPYVLHKLSAALQPYNQPFIHAVVYEKDGEHLTFNITNYDGMSSSILEFGTHPTFSPDTVFEDKINVTTLTIDTIVATHGIQANFLNMDLQGAELHALRGATSFLSNVDYIFTEVNSADVYVGCAKVEELDAFLPQFQRVETYWVPDQGWGDALYVRNP